ncbi:MAG: 5'/3'-nucleotidase SurE [Acidobacteriota bacterium]
MSGGTGIRILVTNDDGVSSPGILALAERLREVGAVTIVAPAREVSGISHALTVSAPVVYERLAEHVFSVEGTPADCVNLAVRNLLPQPPELVVSGINRGANLGEDVTYSGTVAGAREGSMLGIAAFAVSLATKFEADYSLAAEFSAHLARTLETKKLPAGTFLNVNVPPGEIKGVCLTSHGHGNPQTEPTEAEKTASRFCSWLKGKLGGSELNGLSDIRAVLDHLISVTPLHTDITNYGVMEELSSWGLTWNGRRREESG